MLGSISISHGLQGADAIAHIIDAQQDTGDGLPQQRGLALDGILARSRGRPVRPGPADSCGGLKLVKLVENLGIENSGKNLMQIYGDIMG